MKIYVYFFLIILFVGIKFELTGRTTTLKPFDNKAQHVKAISINFKIIPSVNHTWGYDIYRGGKMIIHQQSIPGMPGNEGFGKKLQAKKTARLVINKIEHGEMPPTVTPDELKKLLAI